MSVENVDRLAASLGLNSSGISQRLHAFGLTAEERQQLAASWDQVSLEKDRFVSQLYEVFKTVPHLRAVLANESRVQRLKDIQKQYLEELLCDSIDQAYIHKRLVIGTVHHRIRISPQWYLASYAHFFTELVDPIVASVERTEEAKERLITMLKSILFDASLVLDAYGLQEESQRIEADVRNGPGQVDSKFQSSVVGQSASERSTQATDSQIRHIRLTTEDTSNRFTFIGLSSKDLEQLRSLREIFTESSHEVLSAFYEFLSSAPEYQKLVRPEQVDRLIVQVHTYWHELLNGTFDRPYAASRMRIGVIHERIGVTPQIYLAGLARQATGYIRAIPVNRTDFVDVIKSFFRALMFDVTFVIDAYMDARGDTLLRTEGYAKELMAGLRSCVVVVDTNLRIQFANKEFVALVGIDPPMLCKMQLADALHIPELVQLLDVSGTGESAKLPGLFAIGGRFFRASTVKLDQQPGHSQSFHAVLLEDVSDLLRVSHDVEENEGHYARLANSVSAVLWEMDFESKTIEKVSRQALELTGHSDEFFLGKVAAWFNCILEEDRQRFFVCCATIKRGERATCVYRMQHADGRQIWVRSYISRVASHGSSVRLAAVTVDIDQQIRTERLRLDAIGQVSGGIAHVINNCLTVIVNNIEMQAFALGGDLASHQFLHDSLKACQEAASVSKQLQSFAGGQMLRTHDVRLFQSIKERVPALQSLAGKAIRLSVESIGQEWQCRLDVPQLAVAMEHLCANCRDAMPMGGTITITVRDLPKEQLSFDDPGFNRDWVEVAVIDTGCGMTEEVRRRAVEPFFGTHDMAERAGLGLSFVYGFVTQSGGNLLLESQPGMGTTVRMRFPRLVEPNASRHQQNEDTLRPSVLVVDDDENVAQSIAMQLKYMGLRVRTASGEEDALEFLSHYSVDLLLIDVVLGKGSNGIDLAKHIVKLSPNTKVIVMSGFVQSLLVEKGMPDSWLFLAKPFSAQALRGSLNAMGLPTALNP